MTEVDLESWSKSVIKTCRPRFEELWQHLDRQLLAHVNPFGADRQPDSATVDSAVTAANEGESGCTMSDGVSSYWVPMPWMEITMTSTDWVLSWAAKIFDPNSWSLSISQKVALEKPLMAALKRAKLDAGRWERDREKWTMGQLRASARAQEQLTS